MARGRVTYVRLPTGRSPRGPATGSAGRPVADRVVPGAGRQLTSAVSQQRPAGRRRPRPPRGRARPSSAGSWSRPVSRLADHVTAPPDAVRRPAPPAAAASRSVWQHVSWRPGGPARRGRQHGGQLPVVSAPVNLRPGQPGLEPALLAPRRSPPGGSRARRPGSPAVVRRASGAGFRRSRRRPGAPADRERDQRPCSQSSRRAGVNAAVSTPGCQSPASTSSSGQPAEHPGRVTSTRSARSATRCASTGGVTSSSGDCSTTSTGTPTRRRALTARRPIPGGDVTRSGRKRSSASRTWDPGRSRGRTRATGTPWYDVRPGPRDDEHVVAVVDQPVEDRLHGGGRAVDGGEEVSVTSAIRMPTPRGHVGMAGPLRRGGCRVNRSCRPGGTRSGNSGVGPFTSGRLVCRLHTHPTHRRWRWRRPTLERRQQVRQGVHGPPGPGSRPRRCGRTAGG